MSNLYELIEKNPRVGLIYYPELYTPNSWRMWVALRDPACSLTVSGNSCEDVEAKMLAKVEPLLTAPANV